MGIKKMFDGLKKIGKKKYYSRGPCEELLFVGKNTIIEIVCTDERLDVIITNSGTTCNYRDSSAISKNDKWNITSIINSYIGLNAKAEMITNILLNAFGVD